MKLTGKSTLAVLAAAFAVGLMPKPVVAPSAWVAEHLILADGPHAGEKWDPAQTPYAAEILDCLSPEHPANIVSVRKSAQVGLTTLGMGWVGYVEDQEPASGMTVFPTILSVQDYNRDKLQPTIDASRRASKGRKWRIIEQSSRSARGSTAMSKKFTGGIWTLTGANSTSDLRSKTRRFINCEEIDEWEFDLAGQGDPMEMVDARQIAFHAKGNWKKLLQSTPLLKHRSRIDKAFEDGDQRTWRVKCPQCATEQRLVFGGKDTKHGLKFNGFYPYEAHYVCVQGCVVEHHEKTDMVRGGRWIAEAPGPGRQPSFHIDSLISLLTTWDKIAEKFLKAKDDPSKLKAFVNLWLGESWEERGDAPEWKSLLLRAEDYELRQIPPGALVITTAADVQMDGIYFETVAWGIGLENWSIDVGYIEGKTADPDDPVWQALNEIYEREYPDAYGGRWPCDALGIDAGYNSHVVYDWCRKRPKAMALKGEPGWFKAPISTAPSYVDINLKGRRHKRGAKLWRVGTWPLKGTLYANLRKEGKRDGQETDPPGYCHFSTSHDERYFRQLTNEVLKDRKTRSGQVVKEWCETGPNHFHDCRIYGESLARHLKLHLLTPEQWLEIARQRGVPKTVQGDLFALPVDAQESKTPAPSRKRGRRVISRGVA